jgi:putative ABC transport system permease protein
MLRFALKNVLARKGRLVLSGLAVVLGVAFMVGTMVFTDTIQRTFDSLFADVNEGTDVVVRSASAVDDPFGGEQRAEIDDEVLTAVRAVDGVRAAFGDASGWAIIVGRDGKAINAGAGPPAIGFAWIDDDDLNPLVLAEGNAPRAADDVVIDRGVAKREDFQVGDRVGILTKEGAGEFTVSGIARFGDADSPAGATLSVFTTETAQRLLTTPGRWDLVIVAAEPGITQDELRERVAAALSGRWVVSTLADDGVGLAPEGAELQVLTGREYIEEQQDVVREQLGFFSTMLLAFAFVALFVGAFVIYNSFAITVAQRTREMALLRAVGARRSQVTRAVIVEAAVTGLVAAAVGVGAGMLLAIGLREMLAALGIDIPATELTVTASTVITGLVVGVVVTVVASVLPARRASRVSPMAALRESDSSEAYRPVRRTFVGAAILAAGAGLIIVGLFADVDNAFAVVGVGALVFFLGTAALGPVVAPLVAPSLGSRLVGDVMTAAGVVVALVGGYLAVRGIADGETGTAVLGVVIAVFSWAFVPATFAARGVQGRIARDNMARNPKRSASTASALMVGVALVAFFTIFAASARASLAAIIEDQVIADFVVDTGFGFGGLAPRVADEIAAVPGVAAAGGVRGGPVRVFEPGAAPGDEPTRFVSALDPALADALWDVGFVAGTADAIGFGDVAVYQSRARSMGLRVGDTLDVEFLDGGRQTLTVRAIYASNELLNDFVVSLETWEANVAQQFDFLVAISAAEGTDLAELRERLEEVVAPYPNATLRTQEEYSDNLGAQIDAILNLFYGLIGFAVVIAAFGIANTLALSILERTREIGLLRAVGMDTSQLRRSIRWESMTVALFGTVGGIAVGTFFGWIMVLALRDEGGFRHLVLPPVELFAIVVVGVAVGVVSAVVPARRAAKLDVLDAISRA